MGPIWHDPVAHPFKTLVSALMTLTMSFRSLCDSIGKCPRPPSRSSPSSAASLSTLSSIAGSSSIPQREVKHHHPKQKNGHIHTHTHATLYFSSCVILKFLPHKISIKFYRLRLLLQNNHKAGCTALCEQCSSSQRRCSPAEPKLWISLHTPWYGSHSVCHQTVWRSHPWFSWSRGKAKCLEGHLSMQKPLHGRTSTWQAVGDHPNPQTHRWWLTAHWQPHEPQLPAIPRKAVMNCGDWKRILWLKKVVVKTNIHLHSRIDILQKHTLLALQIQLKQFFIPTMKLSCRWLCIISLALALTLSFCHCLWPHRGGKSQHLTPGQSGHVLEMVHASIRTQRAGWHSSWEHKRMITFAVANR